MSIRYQYFVVMTLMLITTACDSPSGPDQEEYHLPPMDDVVVVLKMRVPPSQEARVKQYFNTLQVRGGDRVFPIDADGVVSIEHDPRNQSVSYRLETKAGLVPQFCTAVTGAERAMKLEGEHWWDILPVTYVVADGPFAGKSGSMSSCDRIQYNCELHEGQDVAFYPKTVCGNFDYNFETKEYEFEEWEFDEPWRYVLLSFADYIPSDYRQQIMAFIKASAQVAFGPGEWYKQSADTAGVDVLVDSSIQPGCQAGSLEAINGVGVNGEWLCKTIYGFGWYGDHEGAHLFGFGHICGRLTRMTAPNCQQWRTDSFTEEDVVSMRIAMDYNILAHSGESDAEPLGFSLVDVRRAQDPQPEWD